MLISTNRHNTQLAEKQNKRILKNIEISSLDLISVEDVNIVEFKQTMFNFYYFPVGLTRTESVGRSESERPKGILKRTPSLKQTGVHVDPELAEVLKSRRHKEEEEEEGDQKLTVEEEIRQQR